MYVCGSSGTTELMLAISGELNKLRPQEAYFLSPRRIDFDLLVKDLGRENKERIIDVDYERQVQITTPNLQFLEESEKKYDFKLWDLWEITAARKDSRRKIPEEKILRWCEYIIRKVEDLLEKKKITFFVHYGPACFLDVIILKMMESNNIKIMELQPSPLPRRFGIAANLKRDWPELVLNYDRLQKTKRGKTSEETEKIRENYRQKVQKPDCLVAYEENNITKVKRYSKIAIRMIKYWDFLPNYRPLFWKVIQKTYDVMGIFESPVQGEKYVLYPLHYQPEASTSIYGKWYNNQLYVIECLIRALPANYKLYIKEHSNGYGNRQLKFYKEIKKYPRVRLISPHVKNLDLIENSSLCVTITGTTAWEALMLQKPALFFGDTYYKVFKGIKRLDRMEDLSRVMGELLDQKIDLNEVIISTEAMLQSTYPGLAFLPGGCNNFSLEKENIALLVKGMNEHIKKVYSL